MEGFRKCVSVAVKKMELRVWLVAKTVNTANSLKELLDILENTLILASQGETTTPVLSKGNETT